MPRVLIADDSATARFFCRRCLQAAGLIEAEFLEAADGAQALEILRAQRPDLLITDLMMPVMDGVELLRRIQASPKLHGLPVIVVSSAGNAARERELRLLGAGAVLGKPVSPAALAAALVELLPGTGGAA